MRHTDGERRWYTVRSCRLHFLQMSRSSFADDDLATQREKKNEKFILIFRRESTRLDWCHRGSSHLSHTHTHTIRLAEVTAIVILKWTPFSAVSSSLTGICVVIGESTETHTASQFSIPAHNSVGVQLWQILYMHAEPPIEIQIQFS